MEKKIVFSLVLSLNLLVAVSAPLLFAGASFPVLAHEGNGDNGGGGEGGHGGNGGVGRGGGGGRGVMSGGAG